MKFQGFLSGLTRAGAEPIQGNDSIRTFTQIVSLQALHYLALAIFTPPFLATFTSKPRALMFEGGPASIGILFDWRELAGRPTWDWDKLAPGRAITSWAALPDLQLVDSHDKSAAANWRPGSVWLGDDDSHTHTQDPVVIPASHITRLSASWEHQDKPVNAEDVGSDPQGGLEQWEWEQTHDPSRSWAIAASWIISVLPDTILLQHIIRRPTHMLDHVLTFHLLHLVLSSIYSSSLPTSIFWWVLMASHAAACIIAAERMAIAREMKEGLGGPRPSDSVDPEASTERERQGPHVLFDEDEEDSKAGKETHEMTDLKRQD